MSDTVYKSNFTGSQIDEAVNKVINGDIEGSNIKEGSIPLSALDNAAKKELDNKLGLYGYYGSLGQNVKNIDTDMYHMGTVFVVQGNNFRELHKGTYDLSEFFGGPSATLNVYEKGMYLSLELQDSSGGYWNDIAIYKGYNKPPQETPDWNTIKHSPVSYFDANNGQFITMDNLQRIIIDDSFTRTHDGDVGVTYSKKLEEWVECHFFHTMRDIWFGDKDGNGPLTYMGSMSSNSITLSIADNVDITLYFDYDAGVLSISMEEYYEERILNLIRDSIPLYYYLVDGAILINHIPDSYLSNNIARSNEVVKTSRQTLSNTEKNQALTNLGIDPVVWKYMCNPYKIFIESDYNPSGQTIPDDLLTLLRKDPYVIALNCIVFYDNDRTCYYKPTEANEDSTDSIVLIFAGDKEVILNLSDGNI